MASSEPACQSPALRVLPGGPGAASSCGGARESRLACEWLRGTGRSGRLAAWRPRRDRGRGEPRLSGCQLGRGRAPPVKGCAPRRLPRLPAGSTRCCLGTVAMCSCMMGPAAVFILKSMKYGNRGPGGRACHFDPPCCCCAALPPCASTQNLADSAISRPSVTAGALPARSSLSLSTTQPSGPALATRLLQSGQRSQPGVAAERCAGSQMCSIMPGWRRQASLGVSSGIAGGSRPGLYRSCPS